MEGISHSKMSGEDAGSLRDRASLPARAVVGLISSLGASSAAFWRSRKKHHDQKQDRSRKLVERNEEENQSAHRARVQEDEVTIKKDCARGSYSANHERSDGPATAAIGKKTRAAQDRVGAECQCAKATEQCGKAGRMRQDGACKKCAQAKYREASQGNLP